MHATNSKGQPKMLHPAAKVIVHYATAAAGVIYD